MPPLTGTMGRVEAEAFATLMIEACVFHGDEWQPLTLKQIGEAVQAALASKKEPFDSLNTNPFWRPDVWDLISRGYAEQIGNDKHAPVRFTDKAFHAMKQHVIKNHEKEST